MASKEQIEDDAYQAWIQWTRNTVHTLGLTILQIDRMRTAFVAGYLEGRKDG